MLKLSIILCLTVAARASAAEPAAVKLHPKYDEYAKEFAKGKAGDAHKQTVYGTWYYTGQGAPMNSAKAAEILRLPAERGYALAQVVLGGLLDDGTAGKRDIVEAGRWLERAAEQGNTDAQKQLALLHMPVKGERPADGFPEDPEKTYFWSSLATLADDTDAMDYRETAMGRLSPDRISALNARLLAWEPKRGLAWKGQTGIARYPCFPCVRRMADDGDPHAQWLMGILTGPGVVLPRDDAKALYWFRRSAAQGNLSGQRKLAEVHYMGRGVAVDYAEAYFWIGFVVDAATTGGWFETDDNLQTVADISHAKIGRARAEELDRKRAAWKPMPEKKAAKPKAP